MRSSLFFFALFLKLATICRSAGNSICQPDSTDTIAEIIDQCRGKKLFWGSDNDFKWEGISQEDFQSIFSHTIMLHANLEIVASTAKQLIFPKLEEYTVTRDLPTSYHYNENLEVLGFPKLLSFTAFNPVSISHNPKLQELYFPELQEIHFSRGYSTVANNSVLTTVLMPAVHKVWINELTIIQNPMLQIVELKQGITPEWRPMIDKRIEIKGKLVIAENDMLERVDFRVNMEEMPVTIHGMEIRKNRRLKIVPFVFNASNIEMRIEGNPQMSRKVLEGLRTAANLSWGRIQDYGECIMEEEIRQLAILDECLYIYGDLILAAGARGAASGRLTRVEGNVYTSDLSLARLKFLLDADIYGRFESDLCDFDYSPFKSAKKGVRKSCTEAETTTEMTTMTTTIKSTEKLTTERETTGTTEGREEATSTISAATVSTTVTVEETVITSTIREEMSTEEEPTEISTQIIPMTESLREFTSTQNPKAKQSVPTRILIICAAAVFIILLAGSAALLCYRKSKKKEEPKMVEVSPNASSSDSTSSRPTPQPASKSPGL